MVMRIVHKKELGCQAMAPVVIKEEVRENATSAKIDRFWKLLGGKKGVKCKCFKGVERTQYEEFSFEECCCYVHLMLTLRG